MFFTLFILFLLLLLVVGLLAIPSIFYCLTADVHFTAKNTPDEDFHVRIGFSIFLQAIGIMLLIGLREFICDNWESTLIDLEFPWSGRRKVKKLPEEPRTRRVIPHSDNDF